MKNKTNIIIGGIVIVAVVLIAIMLSTSGTYQEDTLLSTASGTDLTNSANFNSNDIIRSEAFFVEQINRLQSVTLDNTSILSDQGLLRLKDNTVPIPNFPAGRNNPFAPIDARTQVESRAQVQAILAPVQTPVTETEITSEPQVSDDTPGV